VSSSVQLTIDGREEPERVASRHGPLTAAQLEILRVLAEHGRIRSTEAGRIVHAHRRPPCERCQRGRCGFTSPDGSAALKRLQERGLVHRIAAGLWSSEAERVLAPAAATSDDGRGARGPKGARVGDVVIAERSRWRVEALDSQRREAVCRLIGGSGVIRRFRARRIVEVERSDRG
jgi:hypothetical protein